MHHVGSLYYILTYDARKIKHKIPSTRLHSSRKSNQIQIHQNSTFSCTGCRSIFGTTSYKSNIFLHITVQNYAAKHRPSTRKNIYKALRVNSVKHSSVLPDDGSHKIRNMSELTFNFLSFKLLYNVDFNLQVLYN